MHKIHVRNMLFFKRKNHTEMVVPHKSTNTMNANDDADMDNGKRYCTKKKYRTYRDFLDAHRRELMDTFLYKELFSIPEVTFDGIFNRTVPRHKFNSFEEVVQYNTILEYQIGIKNQIAIAFRASADGLFKRMSKDLQNANKEWSDDVYFGHEEMSIESIKKTILYCKENPNFEVTEEVTLPTSLEEGEEYAFLRLNGLRDIYEAMSLMMSIPISFNSIRITEHKVRKLLAEIKTDGKTRE